MWSVLDRIVLTREEEEEVSKKEKENKKHLLKLHIPKLQVADRVRVGVE